MKKLFEMLYSHKLLAPAPADTADTGTAGTPADPGPQDTATNNPANNILNAPQTDDNPDAGTAGKNILENEVDSQQKPSGMTLDNAAGKPGEDGTAGKPATDATNAGPDGLDDVKGVDGFEYAQGEIDEFKALCKDHSVTPKAAQALLDWQAKFAKAADEKRAADLQSEMTEFVRKESEKNWNLVRKEWGEDPATVAENEAAVARAMRKFSDDGFRKLVNESGLCNHPDMVRFVLKVGKAISDDRFISGRNGGGVKQDLAHRMFPESK